MRSGDNMAAGYSKKPLTEKLGIKPGYRVALVNAPQSYREELGEFLDGVVEKTTAEPPLDFIHLFASRREELEAELPGLKGALKPEGALWVSWPKGASKVATDLSESVVREIGLSNGLVDVKVSAIDEVWSGLKFL